MQKQNSRGLFDLDSYHTLGFSGVSGISGLSGLSGISGLSGFFGFSDVLSRSVHQNIVPDSQTDEETCFDVYRDLVDNLTDNHHAKTQCSRTL